MMQYIVVQYVSESQINYYILSSEKTKGTGQKWYQLLALPFNKIENALVLQLFIEALSILRFKFSVV